MTEHLLIGIDSNTVFLIVIALVLTNFGKDPKTMPVSLVADEKHRWLLGEFIYIPTTVADRCFLGVDIVESADTEALVKG